MSDTPEYTTEELFESFVYLRRQGATPDYALKELKRQKPVISTDERDELASMIRQWERTEGLHHQPNPDAHIQPAPPPQAALPPHDQSECPQCNTMNPSTARYCFSCGTLLTRTGTQQLVSEDHLEGANFGSLSTLVFNVRGYENTPLQVDMDDMQELIIGRTAVDSVIVPDIDLSDYDAQGLGVSRVHATLKRKDTAVIISDMGSVNHTYLNGERVFPQEIRVIRDGDELRLGRLVMRVTFERQLKRIR